MIRSTFAGFTTTEFGMSASQRALDVSGQNIANINTRGYSKQRLEISSLNNSGASFYSSKNGAKVGYGVEVTGISQLRDPFLDIQYRNQMSKLGTFTHWLQDMNSLPVFLTRQVWTASAPHFAIFLPHCRNIRKSRTQKRSTQPFVLICRFF